MHRVQQYIRQYGEGLKRFPMAVSLNVALFVFCSTYYIGYNEAYGKWYFVGTSAATGAMFFAVLWKLWWEGRKGTDKVPAWFDCVLVGILLVFFGLSYGTYGDFSLLYSSGIVVALGAVIAALLSQQYGESMWNFLTWNALKCFALGSVVFLSLGLCLLAWNVLLFTLPTLMPVMIWHFSFFVVAFITFLSLLPRPGEAVQPNMTFGKVLYYVVFPVYLIYLLILYAYVFLIFSRGTLPVGQMNWFVSIALCGFVFFYVTGKEYTKTRWLTKFTRYGGLLLLPLVVAQLWCVYIRYVAYGLTEARYLSLWCTAFGVVVCLASLWVVRNQYIFLLSAVCSLILSVTPFNLVTVPYEQQLYRLQGYLEDASMIHDGKIISPVDITADEVERITSAYGYIWSHQTGHKDEKTRWILSSTVLQNMTAKDNAIRVIYRTDTSRSVPLTGYSKLYPIDTATNNGYITIRTDTGTACIFVEEYAKTMYGIYGEQTNGVVKELTMYPDGDHALYFKTLSIQFNGQDHPFISVTGYLLVR